MHSYATAGWENFFVAEVGAAAALAGLLFVAVSINLSKVLAHPQLPGRAGESLFILMGVLATATLGLVPGQTSAALGGEILGVGALSSGRFPIWLQRCVHRPGTPRSWIVPRVFMHQIATLCRSSRRARSVLAGAGRRGSIGCCPRGRSSRSPRSLLNAWVLLVEIQR